MIVVLGSANMDRMIYVDHFPTVGETTVADYEVMHSGGKGANQSICARKMGSEVYFFGAVGQDKVGNMLLENFQSYGIDITGVNVTTSNLSGIAYITVDNKGDNTILYVPGANLSAKASQIPDYFFNENTVFLIQMEINPAENWKLVYKAKERGSRVILNLAPMKHIPVEIINHIDVLIMNETEAIMLAKILEIETNNFDKIAEYVSNNFNNTCIITLGQNGVVAVSKDGKINVPAIDVKALDTTSAGDAFVGTFASYYEKGFSLKDCITAGNIAGGLTTTKCGAQDSLPDMDEVMAIFRQIKEKRNLI